MNIRVFFYDGVDYSTGEMLAASVAFSENCIHFIGYELLPTDKCSIIMRGTGLKDKKGIEIYEGDQIYPISKNLIYTVVFKDGELGLESKLGYWGSLRRYFELAEKHGWNCKVIGNIYEQQTKKP